MIKLVLQQLVYNDSGYFFWSFIVYLKKKLLPHFINIIVVKKKGCDQIEWYSYVKGIIYVLY